MTPQVDETSSLLFREPITLTERDELHVILQALRAARGEAAKADHVASPMPYSEIRDIVCALAAREAGIAERWITGPLARAARRNADALDSLHHLLLAIDINYAKVKPILQSHAEKTKKIGGFAQS
jgi:hypothetical protein